MTSDRIGARITYGAIMHSGHIRETMTYVETALLQGVHVSSLVIIVMGVPGAHNQMV
jgi:hypothetical protein